MLKILDTVTQYRVPLMGDLSKRAKPALQHTHDKVSLSLRVTCRQAETCY